MRTSGVLEPAMALVLDEWFDHADTDYRTRPHAIGKSLLDHSTNSYTLTDSILVYIRTTPAVAHERVLNRARGEEVTISLDYITQLHHLHEGWISRELDTHLTGDSEMPASIHNSSVTHKVMYNTSIPRHSSSMLICPWNKCAPSTKNAFKTLIASPCE